MRLAELASQLHQAVILANKSECYENLPKEEHDTAWNLIREMQIEPKELEDYVDMDDINEHEAAVFGKSCLQIAEDWRNFLGFDVHSDTNLKIRKQLLVLYAQEAQSKLPSRNDEDFEKLTTIGIPAEDSEHWTKIEPVSKKGKKFVPKYTNVNFKLPTDFVFDDNASVGEEPEGDKASSSSSGAEPLPEGKFTFPVSSEIGSLVYVPPTYAYCYKSGAKVPNDKLKEALEKGLGSYVAMDEAAFYDAKTLTRSALQDFRERGFIGSSSYVALYMHTGENLDPNPIFQGNDWEEKADPTQYNHFLAAYMRYMQGQNEKFLTKMGLSGKATFVGLWLSRVFDLPVNNRKSVVDKLTGQLRYLSKSNKGTSSRVNKVMRGLLMAMHATWRPGQTKTNYLRLVRKSATFWLGEENAKLIAEEWLKVVSDEPETKPGKVGALYKVLSKKTRESIKQGKAATEEVKKKLESITETVQENVPSDITEAKASFWRTWSKIPSYVWQFDAAIDDPEELERPGSNWFTKSLHWLLFAVKGKNEESVLDDQDSKFKLRWSSIPIAVALTGFDYLIRRPIRWVGEQFNSSLS